MGRVRDKRYVIYAVDFRYGRTLSAGTASISSSLCSCGAFSSRCPAGVADFTPINKVSALDLVFE